MENTIEIPEGYKARIEGNKVILEPKVSEDEIIRKALVELVRKHCVNETGCMMEMWLEKQGEHKPTLPDFEEQEGVAGRDYIPVEWVETIENYGKWKIVRTDEQNPAWSEEDDKMIEFWNLYYEHKVGDMPNKDVVENLEKFRDWLKGIKERYTWKPSDEQIKMLNEFLNFAAVHISPHWNDYIFGTLNNLIRQLKKLKG